MKAKTEQLRLGLGEGLCWEESSEPGAMQVCLGLWGDHGRDCKMLRRKLGADLGGQLRQPPGCPPNPCSSSVTRMEF